MNQKTLDEKQIRSLVRKILHLHGLSFQDNIHGDMIREALSVEAKKTS
jgi:hypothetical protein